VLNFKNLRFECKFNPYSRGYFLSFDGKTPISREEVTNMIATSKNKIVEVLAYAREVSIRHGHTRKYAKHLVALAIKQMMHLTDRELAEFLSKS